MNETLALIKNFWAGMKNSVVRLSGESKVRTYAFSALGIGFAVGTYALFHWLLLKLHSFEVIGPILIEKLLFIIFLTFLMMLVFSNIITALSTFYLSNDLPFLFSSPLKVESIFSAKFFETVLQSSWTVLFFGIPVFLAYGIIMKSPWVFYPLIPVYLIPFLIIPAGLGIAVTIVLVRVYPVKRIKEITLILSLGFAAALILYFRFLQPERFANPEGFSLLTDYLAFMRGPSSQYLPSYWISATFLNTIKGDPGEVVFYFLVMLSAAGVSYLLAEKVAGKIYYESWTRSLNKITGKPIKFSLLEKMLGTKSIFNAFLLRDVRIFWRDVTQWSQIILFIAIAAIYIFNLKSFRLQTSSTMLITFINLSFTGFVIAATGVRFSFPALSLEGKGFWIIMASPHPMKTLLAEKFWTSFLPLLALGEALSVTSNLMLKTSHMVMLLGAAEVFLMSLGLTALAVGMGAQYPKFKAENPAEVGGSYGGIMYMIFGLCYVGLMIFLLDPQAIQFIMYMLHFRQTFGIEFALSISCSLLLTFFVTFTSLRNGLRSLNQFEWK